jgi:hypothetical protein
VNNHRIELSGSPDALYWSESPDIPVAVTQRHMPSSFMVELYKADGTTAFAPSGGNFEIHLYFEYSELY